MELEGQVAVITGVHGGLEKAQLWLWRKPGPTWSSITGRMIKWRRKRPPKSKNWKGRPWRYAVMFRAIEEILMIFPFPFWCMYSRTAFEQKKAAFRFVESPRCFCGKRRAAERVLGVADFQRGGFRGMLMKGPRRESDELVRQSSREEEDGLRDDPIREEGRRGRDSILPLTETECFKSKSL